MPEETNAVPPEAPTALDNVLVPLHAFLGVYTTDQIARLRAADLWVCGILVEMGLDEPLRLQRTLDADEATWESVAEAYARECGLAVPAAQGAHP